MHLHFPQQMLRYLALTTFVFALSISTMVAQTRTITGKITASSDDVSGSNYRRIKMASVFVKYLQGVKDPRLGVWAAKVEIPLVVDAALPAGTDKIEGGKRYLSPDKVGKSGC